MIVCALHLRSLRNLVECAVAVVSIKDIYTAFIVYKQIEKTVVVEISPNAPNEEHPNIIHDGALSDFGEGGLSGANALCGKEYRARKNEVFLAFHT